MNNIPLYEYIKFSIRPWDDSHLSCFHRIMLLWTFTYKFLRVFFGGHVSSFLLGNLGVELIVAILGGVKWYLHVVLIYNSLIFSDIKLLFIVLIGCLYIFFVTLFGSFAHLWNELLIFLLLNGKSSLFILDTSALSGIWFSNILSGLMDYVFNFLSNILWSTVLILISPFYLLCHLCCWCYI